MNQVTVLILYPLSAGTCTSKDGACPALGAVTPVTSTLVMVSVQGYITSKILSLTCFAFSPLI